MTRVTTGEQRLLSVREAQGIPDQALLKMLFVKSAALTMYKDDGNHFRDGVCTA